VVYLNIDMEQIRFVDSEAKTFDAEFSVSLDSDQQIGLENVEFTNAYRSDASGDPVLRIRSLLGGDEQGHRLYKVSGRFSFDPDLSNYPFDRQRFTISLAPVNTATPFLLQPPPSRLRNQTFEIDGWSLLNGTESGYVGSQEDIVTTFENYASERHILPFHKFNFTWAARRNVLDYYLRVVTPLGLIVLVAYLSVFIPNSKFDSVMAVQVTAILSTVALYLAIPKLDAETATMSDQIFIFSEGIIGLMMAISIVRVNAPKRIRKLDFWLMVVQAVVMPLAVLLMFWYVRAVQASGS